MNIEETEIKRLMEQNQLLSMLYEKNQQIILLLQEKIKYQQEANTDENNIK